MRSSHPYIPYPLPAGQAFGRTGLYYLGQTAWGSDAVKINCAEWVSLSAAEKLDRTRVIRSPNPYAVIRRIDDFCVRQNSYTRPAGQTSDGNPVPDLTFAPDEGAPVAPPVAPVAPALTPQQETALFNAVGSTLHTTGDIIAAVIREGDQLRMAQIAADTQVKIAQLLSESQRAAASGNDALARSRAADAAQLQQLRNLLAARQPTASSATPYIIGAVAIAAIVGAVMVFGHKSSPSRSASRTVKSRG